MPFKVTILKEPKIGLKAISQEDAMNIKQL